MTNTERIQANNAELREAIEMAESLPDAGSAGEDVTEETSEYTTKLEALETAITALENELEGKASGGGSSGVELETITIVNNTENVLFFGAYACYPYDSVDIPIGDSFLCGFISMGAQSCTAHYTDEYGEEFYGVISEWSRDSGRLAGYFESNYSAGTVITFDPNE